MPHRATRDVDLLGFGASNLHAVAQTFREIAAIDVDDGMAFDPTSVMVEDIRKEAGYGGVRVVITGELAKARCKTQIDVGFGDAITPAPVDAVYPVLLADLPAPRAFPIGLSDEFAHDPSRQALWLTFRKKNELAPEPLPAVVNRLRLAWASTLEALGH